MTDYNAENRTSGSYFAPLAGEPFVVLTTFRQSGAGVPTTVWFAEEGDTIYMTTMTGAKKIGRINANPHVLLTPSDRVGATHGTTVEAQARMLQQDEYDTAIAALQHKYGEQYEAFTGRMDAAAAGSRVFIAVTPRTSSVSDQ